MWNEHFGIGIVEMMAAGLIVVAHKSGGPQMDIIVQPGVTGFLADTVEEYAEALYRALTITDDQGMRQRAQTAAERFSDSVFVESFRNVIADTQLL